MCGEMDLGQGSWEEALGNTRAGALLLDFFSCQALGCPAECLAASLWLPNSSVGLEGSSPGKHMGLVGGSLLFFPPDHHRHEASALHPGWDMLPAPSPMSYPASSHQLLGTLHLRLRSLLLHYQEGTDRGFWPSQEGLKGFCFTSILSSVKEANLPGWLQADRIGGIRQGNFPQQRCAPGLRGGKRLLCLE